MSQARDHSYVEHLLDSAREYAEVNDTASTQVTPFPCLAQACGRHFRDIAALQDHAEAVHTFEDIRRILAEYIREEFGRRGDYKADPVVPAIWTWIDDLATDWVVFMVEEGNDSKLLKASYALTDGDVTLGETTEVRRRTVYEPVKKKSDDD